MKKSEQLDQLSAYVTELEIEIDNKNEEIDELKSVIDNCNKVIDRLQKPSTERKDGTIGPKSYAALLDQNLIFAYRQLSNLSAEISRLTTETLEKDKQLKEANDSIASRDRIIVSLNQIINKQDDKIREFEMDIEAMYDY